jgi:hypothetical protein
MPGVLRFWPTLISYFWDFELNRGKIVSVFHEEVKSKIAQELARGEAARLAGFEGRARVCARRAAGAAVREYLNHRGISGPGPSAFDLLAFLQEMPEVSMEIRQAAGRLVIRVDESFSLPVETDLLAEAAWLAQALEASLDEDGYRRGI